MNETATQLTKYLFRDDPEVSFRIQTGTAANRMGFGKLKLFHKGKPVQRAAVNFQQTNHAFRFGANLFMLDQFGSQEENDLYRERFTSTFNFATVPFYWSDLEPEQGHPRFDKNSPNVYRRPAPDLCMDFCQRHNIGMKGHCLMWQTTMPTWTSSDRKILEKQFEKHFREIGERYSSTIRVWDVINENGSWQDSWRYQLLHQALPDHHAEFAFKLAERYFPGCELLYNDALWPQRQYYSLPNLLADHLLQAGCKLDGLGVFSHQTWNSQTDFKAMLQSAHAVSLNALRILQSLDALANTGLPVNISELTINGYLGEDYQEKVLERFYRLCFSHPAVNGIFYWNLVDDTAYESAQCNENEAKGGILHRDLSPKPAYHALNRLIHKEWMSQGTLDYEAGASNKFQGFYGDYTLEIKTEAGTVKRKINLSKHAENRFVLEI